jgi:hypothetical protein
MKRDMDLVREILAFLESRPKGNYFEQVQLDARTSDEIEFHMRIMDEAGLVEVSRGHDEVGIGPGGGGPWASYGFARLTWQGAEFLAKAKDDGLWAQAKATVGSKLGAIPFDVLSQMMTRLAMKAAGLE